MTSEIKVFTFTIANGTSLSAGVNLKGYVPVAIVMPAAWPAADISFSVSHDGVYYSDLYDEFGSEVRVTAPAASRSIRISASDWFSGFTAIKLRSGLTGTPVNQGADRTLQVACRAV